jgi:hypothetical protein
VPSFLAKRLHADLQDNAVRCWFAPEDMKIGDEIRSRIDQSIRLHDKLLVVLSEHSTDSDWVEDEVETALEEERKRKQTVLFLIRLGEAVMETDEAWAAKIRRTRHIGDFSRSKDHDSYGEAFDRLLPDLKAEEGWQTLSLPALPCLHPCSTPNLAGAARFLLLEIIRVFKESIEAGG